MVKNNNTKEEPIEKQLWKAANKLRKNIDAAEYKHIVLGLIFLKYISDAFQEHRQILKRGEGDIRKALVEARLIDCIVNLPAKLFLNTQIPASLWFLSRNRENGKFRNRKDEILFIDARNMGYLINRRTRELSEEDIRKIADTYHRWRSSPSPNLSQRERKNSHPQGNMSSITDSNPSLPLGEMSEGTNSNISLPLGEMSEGTNSNISLPLGEMSEGTNSNISLPLGEMSEGQRGYEDIKGFCNSATVERVKELDYVLTPGRYVGLPDDEDDFDFNERFTTLKVEFEEQLKEEEKLNELIKQNLAKINLSE